MNLAEKFTTKEIKLLNNIGINIENRDYSKEEIKDYEMEISDFIMWHSSKNGDIKRLMAEYSGVLNTIVRYQQNNNL